MLGRWAGAEWRQERRGEGPPGLTPSIPEREGENRSLACPSHLSPSRLAPAQFSER